MRTASWIPAFHRVVRSALARTLTPTKILSADPVFPCSVKDIEIRLDLNLQSRESQLPSQISTEPVRERHARSLGVMDFPAIRSISVVPRLVTLHHASIVVKTPAVGNTTLNLKGGVARSRSSGVLKPPRIRDAERILLGMPPPIRSKREVLARLPHRRRNMVPEGCIADVADYLTESELHQGSVLAEWEVLAIFPRVPVEMLSRLSFRDDYDAASYTLAPMDGRRTTRVRKLAVLQEKKTRVIRYASHRTRSETAILKPN